MGCVCVGGGCSVSDCHMIRHRDGVCVCVGGEGVFCLRLSHY